MLSLLPDGDVRVVGQNAVFFAGDVPGLEQLPDYGLADDDEIERSIAGWNSTIEIREVHVASA